MFCLKMEFGSSVSLDALEASSKNLTLKVWNSLGWHMQTGSRRSSMRCTMQMTLCRAVESATHLASVVDNVIVIENRTVGISFHIKI